MRSTLLLQMPKHEILGSCAVYTAKKTQPVWLQMKRQTTEGNVAKEQLHGYVADAM